jgi:hypothetical protein
VRHTQACFAKPDRATERDDPPCRFSETTRRPHERRPRDSRVLLRGEKKAMVLEEADDASLLASYRELVLEAGLQGCHAMLLLDGSSIGRLRPVRFRRGLCHEYERAQANE